jgi:hypothetical protein
VRGFVAAAASQDLLLLLGEMAGNPLLRPCLLPKLLVQQLLSGCNTALGLASVLDAAVIPAPLVRQTTPAKNSRLEEVIGVYIQ